MDILDALITAKNLLIADIADNTIKFARYNDIGERQEAERELVANGNALYFIRQALDSLEGWEN